MSIFQIDIRFCATAYIQAENIESARGKLGEILGKQIDANNRDWFSLETFDSPFLPEVSLSTGMTAYAHPDSVPVVVKLDTVNSMFANRPERAVIAQPRNNFPPKGLRIYWADPEIWATVFVKADSPDEAMELVATGDWDLHLEQYPKGFSAADLDDTDFSVAISPYMKIAGLFEGGTELELHWSQQETRNAAKQDARQPGYAQHQDRMTEILAELLKDSTGAAEDMTVEEVNSILSQLTKRLKSEASAQRFYR
ncbi:hypothetical protein [Agrobacterium pusense]|uniref:hypothetical protein n=1 Tax=Agrobacterium TaxID=357 RepID=UPI000D368B63|nr:hypothetical protein [Agrobacterium pusense]PTV72483.1 hypothetical protein DBL06_20090 [Agrobacterium pusense]